MEKDIQAEGFKMKVDVVILISDKIDFKSKLIRRVGKDTIYSFWEKIKEKL